MEQVLEDAQQAYAVQEEEELVAIVVQAASGGPYSSSRTAGWLG